MLKIKFILTIFFLLAFSTLATDSELFIPNAPGDIQSYLLEVVGDSQFMNFFYDLLTVTEEVGDSSFPSVDFYDLIVNVDKQEYQQGKTVKATITIINNGDTPDKDAILRYSLIEPEGKKLLESKEHRIEAPVVTYNKEKCYQYGGILERGRCMLKIDLEMKLPDEAKLGEWKFATEYITVKQGKLEDYAGFRVIEDSFFVRCVKEHPWLFLLSIIILLIIIIGLIIDDVKQRN